MTNPRLAHRYAKSLLDLSNEKGQVDAVYNDMLLLQSIIKSNRDFVNLLRSPIIHSDKKEKIIDAVTEGKVSVLTTVFIKLLVTKGRESNLPEVINSFIEQYKQQKGIQVVKLTTAAPVSDAVKNAIVEQIKRTSDIRNIELETTVNDKIIGGFVLQAGDKLIDASVAYDLKQIAKQFENNDFIYKVR